MNVTTIEQSKKLLELGLKAETADLFYDIYINPITNEEEGQSLDFVSNWQSAWGDRNKSDLFDERAIPAWSLGALLELMKNYPDCNKLDAFSNRSQKWSVTISYYDHVWKEHEEINMDLMKCVYNIVVWLLENGYIKNGF